MNRCPEVPDNPQDGDRFTCPRCGYSAEFVVLDDGKPGEWVDVTSPACAVFEGLRSGPCVVCGRPLDDHLPPRP